MKGRIGLLSGMMAMIASVISSRPTHVKGKKIEYQPVAPIGGGQVLIRSHGTPRVYGKLPRREVFAEAARKRRAAHAAKVWNLRQEGILWTPHGLYWMTRKLAEANA